MHKQTSSTSKTSQWSQSAPCRRFTSTAQAQAVSFKWGTRKRRHISVHKCLRPDNSFQTIWERTRESCCCLLMILVWKQKAQCSRNTPTSACFPSKAYVTVLAITLLKGLSRHRAWLVHKIKSIKQLLRVHLVQLLRKEANENEGKWEKCYSGVTALFENELVRDLIAYYVIGQKAMKVTESRKKRQWRGKDLSSSLIKLVTYYDGVKANPSA